MTNAATGVSDGLFTVTLNFGAGVFNGANRWLEIAARTNGGGAFTVLSPRQAITATPYALTAGNLSGPLPGTQLTGTIPDARLSTNVSLFGASIDSSEITDGPITTNDLHASVLNGTFWKLGGNTGANPTNGIFLGTTDHQPLEFEVNGVRSLRLEPTFLGDLVNVIGGSPFNSVAAGTYGATIGGGGGNNGQLNQVTGVSGTVGGGIGNTAGPFQEATVGGGKDNTASGPAATVAGGNGNIASGTFSAVGDGQGNAANNLYATVPGGEIRLAAVSRLPPAAGPRPIIRGRLSGRIPRMRTLLPPPTTNSSSARRAG